VTRFPGVARPGNKGVARKNQEAGIIPWSGRASHNLGLRNQGPFVIITKIISSGLHTSGRTVKTVLEDPGRRMVHSEGLGKVGKGKR